MTICIGVVCQNRKRAIFASDRMLTSPGLSVEFEHNEPKFEKLSLTCVGLSAGEANSGDITRKPFFLWDTFAEMFPMLEKSPTAHSFFLACMKPALVSKTGWHILPLVITNMRSIIKSVYKDSKEWEDVRLAGYKSPVWNWKNPDKCTCH